MNIVDVGYDWTNYYLLEQQLPTIPILKSYMKPVNPYVNGTLRDNLQMTTGESRVFLKRIGIAGEII